MNIYGLPLDLDTLNDIKTKNTDVVIDMSDLSFPCEDNFQVRSAFLFIRNTNLKCKFDFSKCDYKSKCEFLLQYMKDKLNVDITELTTTWIHIIGNGYINHDNLNSIVSILSDDEIKRFEEENSGYINELRKIMASIPIASIIVYNDMSEENQIPMDDLQTSTFDEVNLHSFGNIFDFEEGIYLQQLIDDYIPLNYVNLFISNNYDFGKLVEKFPYLDMMNLFSDNGQAVRNRFLENIDKVLNIKEEG